MLVGTAKIVETGISVWRAKESVLGAFTMAEVPHLTIKAISRQGRCLGLAEFPLKLRTHHFTERMVENVA